jgi:hypothetical protein
LLYRKCCKEARLLVVAAAVNTVLEEQEMKDLADMELRIRFGVEAPRLVTSSDVGMYT